MKLFQCYSVKDEEDSSRFLVFPIMIHKNKVIDIYFADWGKGMWEVSTGSKSIYRKYGECTDEQQERLIKFIFDERFIREVEEVKK